MRRALLAVAVVATLALPASAVAATVSIAETPGYESLARLSFEATPAEADHLTVSVASESTDHYQLQLLDTTAAVEPGAGCSGGGAPGVAVTCQIHKPEPRQYSTTNCTKATGCPYQPGSFWETTMSFSLGDGGSALDASSLPPPPVTSNGSGPQIAITVAPGSGDDTILTAGGNDKIEPSLGSDTVRTSNGDDMFLGGLVPDGADDVDLGPGRNTADYRERKSSVEYHEDDLANDGAPGEGDRIVGTSTFWGGAGADVIEGSSSHAPLAPGDAFVGGAGNDLLIGGEGDDVLFGGEGDDRLYGRGGADYLNEPLWGVEALASGDDFADGGGEADEIHLGYGDDRAEGGGGSDRIDLGPGADSGEGGADGDFLRGGEGDDRLAGGEGGDRLLGDRGHDTLEGGAGDDRIAAGAVAQEPWGYLFLYSPGPIENEPDRVDCGIGGDDRATIDRTDTVIGCDEARRLRLLETFGVFQTDGLVSAQLQYEVRKPGLVTLSSSGLQPQHQKDDSQHYYSSTGRLLLDPVGRTRRKLARTGSARVRVRVALHWGGGRKTVRHRVLRLLAPHHASR